MSKNEPSEGLCFDIEPLQEPWQAEAFCRLFLTVYKHPIDLATWRWKYHGAPAGRSLQLIARDRQTGEMVGHFGAVLLPGRLQAEMVPQVLWAQIGDLMVLESARGDLRSTGVYPQLARRMREALPALAGHSQLLAYGFAGQRPFTLGRRLGFNREIRRCEATDYKRIPPPAWWQRSNRHPLTIWQIDPGSSLEHADVIDHTLRGEPGLVKNAAYLHWRYRSHPQRRYTLWWTARRGQRPTGWLVTALGAEPGSLLLVDCKLPVADQQDAIQALLLTHPQCRLTGWLGGHPGQTQQTPILAGEFGSPDFHAQLPWPHFQPGDTDVF